MIHSFFLGPFLFLLIYYYHAEKDIDDCMAIKSCDICLRTPQCVWCEKPQSLSSGSSSFSHCHRRAGSNQNDDIWVQTCGSSSVIDPKNNVITVEDKSFTNVLNSAYRGPIDPLFGNEDEEQIIQLKPQHVKIALRIGELQSLTVTFKRVENYPLDLYYLRGFAPYRVTNQKKLTDYGLRIGKQFHQLKPVQDFRYGFGAFIDNGRAEEGLTGTCNHFKNIVPLSRQPLSLEKNELPFSSGLNALVQVMKCNDFIPWRKYARKFILFSTDVDYYNSDGKEADTKIQFGDEDFYDYESFLSIFGSSAIRELNKAAREENVNIIFAVTSKNWNTYRMLPFVIQGSIVVEWASDNSNMYSMIKDAYQELSVKLNFEDDAKPPSTVKYFNRCNSVVKEEVSTSECDLDKVTMDEVKLRIEVVAMNVWNSGGKHPRKQRVKISPVGLPDTLTLDLDFITKCDLYTKEIDSFGRGDKRPSKGSFSEFMCKENDHSEVCSGRGECIGGTCVCDRRENPFEKIVGQFCECTNFLCDRRDGLLCSGAHHGSCVCDRCLCKPGFTGRACECEGSNSNCIVPGTHKICSNEGICECNKCKCLETSMGRFTGKYCQDCPTCPAKCSQLRPCVECRLYGSEQHEFDVCSKCRQEFNIELVTFIEFDENSAVCTYLDSDGCQFHFVYGFEAKDSSIQYVKAKTGRECHKPNH